jgi:hypothetical protein
MPPPTLNTHPTASSRPITLPSSSSSSSSSSHSSSPPPTNFFSSEFSEVPLPPPLRKRHRSPSRRTQSQQLLSADSDAQDDGAAAAAAAGFTGGFVCNWSFFPPSKVLSSDGVGYDMRGRGIYNPVVGDSSAAIVNDGSDIIMNFELFHCNQGQVMLAFACLGSNSLAELIDFLHPTFIIGQRAHHFRAALQLLFGIVFTSIVTSITRHHIGW